MVAADGQNRHPLFQHHTGDKIIEQRHRFHRRVAAVINVPRQNQRVWLVGRHARDDLVQNHALIIDHGITIDFFPDVQIGQMEEFHTNSFQSKAAERS